MIITHLNLRSSIYIKLHHNLLAFPTAPLAFCSLDPWWPISGTFQCKLDSWLLSREDRIYDKPNQVQPWRSKNENFQVSPISVLHWFFHSSYSAYLERKKAYQGAKRKILKSSLKWVLRSVSFRKWPRPNLKSLSSPHLTWATSSTFQTLWKVFGCCLLT